MTRRGAVAALGMSSAVVAGGLTVRGVQSARARSLQATPEPGDAPTGGPHQLAPLPYEFGALEPTIGADTMELHYAKLHANYVKELNALVAGQPDLEAMAPEELVANISMVPEDEVANLMGVVKPRREHVATNAGGHVNHTLFWDIMSPDGGGEPTGPLLDAINAAFGNVEAMKDQVKLAGLGNVGSGWVWLASNAGQLSLSVTSDQSSPLVDGSGTPVLGLDVWEHSYVLDYGSERGAYIDAWWTVVNWPAVQARFEAAG